MNRWRRAVEATENRGALWLMLLALSCGIAGETLLFMQRQCRAVESMLLEDFRVLAFAASDLTDSRARIVEEKIRALPGVEEVRFVSREAALEELKASEPDLARSVALLGENPLPAAFEIRLAPASLARMPDWAAAASRLPELADLRFKPLEAHAILQLEFYGRFLGLALSMAAALWFVLAAFGLWQAVRRCQEPRRLWLELWPRLWLALLGTAAGMSFIYLAVYPLKSAVQLWAWPAPQSHALLALTCMLGIGLWPEFKMPHVRRGHEHSPSSDVPAEGEGVTAGSAT